MFHCPPETVLRVTNGSRPTCEKRYRNVFGSKTQKTFFEDQRSDNDPLTISVTLQS